MNKENHKLQTQLDFIKGDRVVVNEMEMMKNELEDLGYENRKLTDDIQIARATIKDYEEQDWRRSKETD